VLPVTSGKPQPRSDKPIFLTLKGDLSLLIGDQPVGVDELASRLDVQTRLDREQRIFVRADQAVSYGEVVRLMNALRAAGYLKIALVGLEGGEAKAPEAPAATPAAKP
jgi:biopolymer transport protein ExbD